MGQNIKVDINQKQDDSKAVRFVVARTSTSGFSYALGIVNTFPIINQDHLKIGPFQSNLFSSSMHHNGRHRRLSALVWSAPPGLPQYRKEKKVLRDFIVLNKGAVQVGLTTAQEHFQYRATHDVRRKDSGHERTAQKIRRIPPTMVFGLPTKPSTPVYDLLGHKYQDRWLDERRKAEEAMRARQEQKRHVDKNIYETRTALLRKHQPPVDPPPLWHMPKFKKVPAHLVTFRSEPARTEAFKNYATDSTSRRGTFGHGIYEPARS